MVIMNNFYCGELVKVVGTNSSFENKIGTVESDTLASYDYLVQFEAGVVKGFPNGVDQPFYKHELVLVIELGGEAMERWLNAR